MVEVQVHPLLGRFAVCGFEGLENSDVLAMGAEQLDWDLERERAEADEVILNAFQHLAKGLVAAVLGTDGVDLLAFFKELAGVGESGEVLREQLEALSRGSGGGLAGRFAFEKPADGV